MRTVMAWGSLAVAFGIAALTAGSAAAQSGPAGAGAAPPVAPRQPARAAGPVVAQAPMPGPGQLPPPGQAPGVVPAPAPAPATVPGQVTPVAPTPRQAPATTPEQAPAPLPLPPSGPATAAAPATPTNDEGTPLRVPSELVEVQPGGLTADQAGARTANTSWNAKASEGTLRSAEARVDQAWASFLPRLTGKFSYERLSEFTPPPVVFQVNGMNSSFPGFPLVFNNWSLQGTLTVPISDYFFSINQKYTAATSSQDAARWNLIGARANALTSGKTEYYTWLRNRGAVIVAVQTLNDQKTHLRDARNQFTVGNASKADVLRAETSVAEAELTLEQASNLSDITEKQLRVDMHLPEEQAILPGEDLEAPLPSFQGNLQQMTSEALTARAEIKSADANAYAASKQAAAAKAGRYPTLSAFGDGIYANPNPRFFPQTPDWRGTWDAGATLSWSPNDVLLANGSVNDFEAQVATIQANKNVTRDAVQVEVQQDWQGVREADFAVQSSTRQLASAEEAYRVQRELFNNGRGTSTTLTDAETDLTRARLTLLNARADARIARIRLDHALGRDIRPANGDPGGVH